MRLSHLCLCLPLAACTDPRARPVAPTVQVSFAPTFKLTSPGQVVGSLYMFDVQGLFLLDLSIRSADSALVGDSSIVLTGEPEITRPINWSVPSGVATGIIVTLVARTQDVTGLVTSDTVRLTVQGP